MEMNIGYSSLILLLVFCEYCILVTWSASNEGDGNLPLVKKSKSPWECSLKEAKSIGATTDSKGDRKGKGIAIKSSSAGAGTSSKRKSEENLRWTSKQNEDLVRYFYAYQIMGLFKGKTRVRDWDKIIAAWNAKYGNVKLKKLRTHAYLLRDKMHLAGMEFDNTNPIKYDIEWAGMLNDDLMKIYYATDNGPKSEHGQKMHAEWVRMKFPCYQIVTPEYLLNRAETMLQNARKIHLTDLHGEELGIVKSGQHMIWEKYHEDFLEKLWEKYPRHTDNRKERIFNDAVAQFEELEAVGATRVIRHARWLRDKRKHADGSMGKRIKKGESENFIVDGNANWKPYHDKYLLSLWNEEKPPKEGKMETIYRKALQKYSELRKLNVRQVYDRARYIKKKTGETIKARTPHQRAMPVHTHGQYYTFIDDKTIPSLNQERIASTSSQPGSSHSQTDSELNLGRRNFAEQTPDTSLRLKPYSHHGPQ